MADFPTEAKYMRVKNYNDKVLARHTTRISPFNGARFGPGSIDRILFNVPSETGMEIDMDTLMLHFNADISFTGNDAGNTSYDIAFNNSIESVIQTLRIRKGTSFLLEDITRYNYVESLFMNYLSKDFNDCVGKACLGIGPYYSRVIRATAANNAVYNTNVAGANNKTRNYCVPFRLSGISNYSGLISTSLIDSVCAFQIEVELAPAADAITINNVATGAPAAVASYELTNCYITYDVVRMAPEYHQQLQASIQRGIPLQIPYKTWRTSMYNLPVNGSMHTFNINDTVKSLNAIFIGFFRQREQSKFMVAGKDRKHKPSTLKSAQLQLGSFYYPLQPMDTTLEASQAFLELQKALGLAHVRSEQTGPFAFDGGIYSKPGLNQLSNLQSGFKVEVPAADGNGIAAAVHKGPSLVYNEFGVAINDSIFGNAQRAANAAAIDIFMNVNESHDAVVATTTANVSSTGPNRFERFYSSALQGPCTEFMIGFNLRKVLDAVEGEIVGTDIQSSGSGLMTLRLEMTGDLPASEGPYNIVIASLYDAVLEIQSNQQTFRVE